MTSIPGQWAQWYASRGWRIFPCHPRAKEPLTAHGFKDATTDPEQLLRWWAATPEANLAVACGAGICVLDEDRPGAIASILPSIPHTVEARSARGRHLFFAGDLPTSSGRVPGLDVRGDGGYVLLSPSVHPDGPTYTWIHSPVDTPLAPVPPSLLTALGPRAAALDADWTDGPAPDARPPADDTDLITRAMQATSAGSVFGGRATFTQLWTGDEDALATAYPATDGRPYDASAADAALAQHLAFWTGRDCERIRRLMEQSALHRDKWDGREDYLPRTILRAVGLQTSVYTGGGATTAATPPVPPDMPRLRAASEVQRTYAEGIRATKLVGAAPEDRATLCERGAQRSARFWIDNAATPPAELAAQVRPIERPASLRVDAPQIVHGYQYMSAQMQVEFFAGCVYVQDIHRIFTASGDLLKPDQFNSTYGGYTFQLDETGDKTTRKAWEAYTESQIVRHPKVQGTYFDPTRRCGEIFEDGGRRVVNTYVPVPVAMTPGDPEPMLDLLRRMLPVERDREIILAYMAAVVQHKGVKFQWAPLLQGAQGNGKTVLTDCVAQAVGERYVHYPQAADLDNKFNAWLVGKILIGVEDIYVPGHKGEILEILKPMITSRTGFGIQAKGQDQYTTHICANFMFNSNHKDAIRKSHDDRRFAIFYSAQQSPEDIRAAGMGGQYFDRLYNWLRAGGYAVIAHYLATYDIPDELNPAGECHRAPETSSTTEALAASLGTVEQEIIEAIGEGRQGFAGGWVSSRAVDRLLRDLRADRAVPPNRRRDLMRTLGYDWHPALKDGRANSVSIVDGGKPRLFIRDGSPGAELTDPAAVLRAYERAQGVTGGTAGIQGAVG